jgi:superfamily II DNA/RNA helicase
LIGKGFTAGSLHGDMNQKERTRTLNRLRDGRMRVLVATDVAARGLDVPGINLVVNYDAPRMADDYVHRIGRTGRAGRAGIAVTFLGRDDRSLMRQIERFTGNKMSLMEIPGLEPRTRLDEPKPGGRYQPRKSYKAASSARKGRGPEERWGRRSAGR